MQWGSVPDWVAAVATAFGFGFAVYQLRLSRLDQRRARDEAREDERATQRGHAASVAVKADWSETRGMWSAHVVVKNASPYPIGSVVLVIASDEDVPMEIVYGSVLPGEVIEETHPTGRKEVVFGELTGGVSLRFSDIHNRHWENMPWGLEERERPARIC